MALRWLRAILLLPGMVLVVVPALLLTMFREDGSAFAAADPAAPGFWLGLAVGIPGLALSLWTARLFHRHGRGTAAPWDPPTRLVVRGPYRHVRNPMISGVVLMLLAECLILECLPLAVWLAVFACANAFYLPAREEKRLVARFGEDYEVYRANVPRWIPRLRPWSAPGA